MDQRLVDLQVKFAFLERTVEELNEVVTRQQSEIQSLEKRLAALQAQLAAPAEDDDEQEPAE